MNPMQNKRVSPDGHKDNQIITMMKIVWKFGMEMNGMMQNVTASFHLSAKNPSPPSLKLFCPEGWIEKAGKCYRLPDETADFHDAAARCQQLGGKLTEPKNKQENDEVINLVKHYSNKSRFWLGFTDENQEGKFVLLSTGEPMTYSSWADDQPDDSGWFSWSGEDCVELRMDWGEKWNDHGCDENKYFICERLLQG